MFQKRSTDGLSYYVSSLLDRAGVPHAFSTRLGGVSPAPFDSLNLGISRDADVRDTSANVEENYRRLRAAIGCDGLGRCWVTQVHGPDVCDVRPGAPFENGTPADALASDDPARLLSVKYADCVPVLLATDDGRAVAAVHAGWRGIVAGVIPAAVERLRGISGAPAGRRIAAIGPCISVEHFEVGPEVLTEFRRIFGADAPARPGRADKGYIDLERAVALQLEAAGLSTPQIDRANLCTFANAADFFSHRRDRGLTGRMAALIAPREA